MYHLSYGRKFLKCLLYIMNMSSELCKSSKNGDNRCTLCLLTIQNIML